MAQATSTISRSACEFFAEIRARRSFQHVFNDYEDLYQRVAVAHQKGRAWRSRTAARRKPEEIPPDCLSVGRQGWSAIDNSRMDALPIPAMRRKPATGAAYQASGNSRKTDWTTSTGDGGKHLRELCREICETSVASDSVPTKRGVQAGGWAAV